MAHVARIRRAIFGEYAFFRILSLSSPVIERPAGIKCRESTDISDLTSSLLSDVRSLASYKAPDSICFVAEDGPTIVGVCWFWYGETYKRRNFWPLQAGEAKLVQVTISQEFRGRGIAEEIIRFASCAMFRRGFGPLYARVWHSHRASLRAFEKAGWCEIAAVLEICTLGKKLRLVRKRRAPQIMAKARSCS